MKINENASGQAVLKAPGSRFKQYRISLNITQNELAGKAGINKSESEKCIEQVRSVVSGWSSFAEAAGLSERNAARIQTFLNHETDF